MMCKEKNMETATPEVFDGTHDACVADGAGTGTGSGAGAADDGAAGISGASSSTGAIERGDVVAATVEFGGVPYAPHAVHGTQRHHRRSSPTLRADWPGTDRVWAGDSSKASQRVFSAVYYNDLVE